MMGKLIKIEKALFYFLVAAFFWQLRLIWPAEHFNEWTSFFIYVTDLVIVALLILWLARQAGKLKKIVLTKTDIGLAIFLIIAAASVLVAQDKSVALFRLAKLLEFGFLYFYVRYNFSALYSLKRFWQWFVAGAALQGVVAIAQFLTQQSLGLKFFAESPLAANLDGVAKIMVGGEKIIRSYGLVPHPNILAAILVVAIFALIWLWLEEKKTRLKTILFSVVLMLLGVALFFAFSRGIIVVGGALFIVWLVYLWRQKEYRQSIIFIFILLFAASCLLSAAYCPYVSARYDLGALPLSQAVNLRLFYNQEALKMLWQEPVLGVGLGNFTLELRDNISLPEWQYQPAHNIYFLAAAESGLAGLLAFLAFLVLTLKDAWPRRKNLAVSCLLAVALFLLASGLFDHFLWDLQQGQLLFWLVLGLLSAHSSMDRAQASEA